METIKVYVGSDVTGSGGVTRDTTRQVEFEGEQLAQYHEAGQHKGHISDTRGTVETLYRAEDGRLVVHVKDWSNWQGEPTTCSLHEVTEADLSGNGRFALLGQEAGLGRPLTLDEALTPWERVEYDESTSTGEILHEGNACAECGEPLPYGTSPYHGVGYLCERCAEPGEV